MTQSAEVPLAAEETDEAQPSAQRDDERFLRSLRQIDNLHGTCARQKVELQKLNRSISRKVHYLKQTRHVLDFLLEHTVTFIPAYVNTNFDGSASNDPVTWEVARTVYKGQTVRGAVGRNRREAVRNLMILMSP